MIKDIRMIIAMKLALWAVEIMPEGHSKNILLQALYSAALEAST